MKRILERLEALSRDMPDDATLEDWRHRIDGLDQVILALLNERSEAANRIGSIKKASGLPIYVPRREEQVLKQVMEGNPGPLPDTAVRRLFERIIDETRSLERHNYQQEDDDPA